MSFALFRNGLTDHTVHLVLVHQSAPGYLQFTDSNIRYHCLPWQLQVVNKSIALIFGAFANRHQKRLLASSCLSVCPHVSARLPLHAFPWNFILGDLYEDLSRKSKFGSIWTKISGVSHETQSTFCKYRRRWIAIYVLSTGKWYQAVWIAEEAQTLRERVKVLRHTYTLHIVSTCTQTLSRQQKPFMHTWRVQLSDYRNDNGYYWSQKLGRLNKQRCLMWRNTISKK